MWHIMPAHFVCVLQKGEYREKFAPAQILLAWRLTIDKPDLQFDDR